MKMYNKTTVFSKINENDISDVLQYIVINSATVITDMCNVGDIKVKFFKQ